MTAASAKVQFVDPSVSFPTIDPLNQIRLLLLSSDKLETLVCRLHVVSINEPPPFEALSYVWGSHEDPHVVTVDGHAFRVTQNLYAALHHLVLPDGAVRVLWIDAICINQGPEEADLAERSRQVRLMNRIFSGATNVVAYLGEPYPGLFEAMEIFTVAAEGQQSDVDRLTQSPDYDAEEVWRALISFFNRPWWSRIWTVQEPMMARTVFFQFGRLVIDFEMVRRGMDNIVFSRIRTPFAIPQLDPGSGESLYTAFAKMSLLSVTHTRASLLDALGAFQNRTSGDPRDKVYSLMGLFPASDHIVNVDYTKPLNQLFQEFTLAWIEKSQNLRVLGYLHHPGHRLHRDMPSFAVDWSYRPSLRAISALHNRSLLQNEAFDACKGSRASWHLELEGYVRANGFIFDSVEAVAEKHSVEYGSSLATSFNTLQEIVGMASERAGTDHQTRTGETLAVIRHTLCMDCKEEGGVYSRLQGEDDGHALNAWWESSFKPSPPPRANRLVVEGGPIERPAWAASLDRSFIFTTGGHMGLAPDWCKPGDAIAIMGGGAVPIVLRPVGEIRRQSGDTPVFEVVGEAYVHGFMDGQAFNASGKTESQLHDIYLV